MLVTLKDVQKTQRGGGPLLFGAIVTLAAAESGKYAEVLKAANIPTHAPESDETQTMYKALEFKTDEVDFIEVAPDMALIVQKYFKGSDYNDKNFNSIIQADSLLPMMHVAVESYKSAFYGILHDDEADKPDVVAAVKSLNTDFGNYMTAAAEAVPGDAFFVYKMVGEVNKQDDQAGDQTGAGDAPAAGGDAGGDAGAAAGGDAGGDTAAGGDDKGGDAGTAAGGDAGGDAGQAAAGAGTAGEPAKDDDDKADANVQKLADDLEKITKSLGALSGLSDQLKTLNDTVATLANRVETVEGVAETISGTVISKGHEEDVSSDDPPKVTPIGTTPGDVWTKAG